MCITHEKSLKKLKSTCQEVLLSRLPIRLRRLWLSWTEERLPRKSILSCVYRREAGRPAEKRTLLESLNMKIKEHAGNP